MDHGVDRVYMYVYTRWAEQAAAVRRRDFMEKTKRSSRDRKSRQKKKAKEARVKLQVTYDKCKKALERERNISNLLQK